MDVAATFCATLADEWARAGITDAVVCPGSRSTPMALALAGEARLRVHVFIDERSAAFFALGVGLRTGVPAIVLTTSGTAAAELHPAVVEAHQAGVPLVAVTADRPPEAHGVGAPQTIDQSDLYGPALRWRAEPGVPDRTRSTGWRSLAARAVIEARGSGGRPGPVHLNLAFREPLVGEPGPLPDGRADGAPWHRATMVRRSAAAGGGAPGHDDPDDLDDLDALAGRLAGQRGVIVAGAGSGRAAAVHRLAEQIGWPVLADARAPARVPAPATVTTFDALLRHRGFATRGRPEVVLRLGAPPASRVLGAWLAASGAEQVAVESHGRWLDPDRTLHRLVVAEPDALCADLADRKPATAPDDWPALWSAAQAAAQEAIAVTLAGHDEATEPGVARDLLGCLAPGTAVVLASSMPVRDVEWFAAAQPGLCVMANRGANGIDGTVSTILGVAAAGRTGPSPTGTVGLVGDLAFLHDAGALVGAADRGLDAVVVVIDNGGGGIFSFLPQAAHLPPARFEQLFGTPHTVDLAALARLHALPVAEVDRAAGLVPAVTEARRTGGTAVVVVRTDRRANVAVHEELQAAVAAAVDAVA
ncbi:MAG: 2-succinyl-5-enolpyruvyl-6-hydroxy-3-cyclohexene-1-carboxylic-acid synthase [Acidimicrobiales bacterium]